MPTACPLNAHICEQEILRLEATAAKPPAKKGDKGGAAGPKRDTKADLKPVSGLASQNFGEVAIS
tara:strand:+ start:222 stop:416 length:195 start_codon:yes stop_codon:yes gene_type:complete